MVCQSLGVDIAVIGLGLIGGSAAQALAAAGHRVTGFDADPATRSIARRHAPGTGQRWRVAESVRDAADGADVVVLAVPLPGLAGVLAELSAAEYPGLVTDVTSVKSPVRDLVEEHLPATARFVGGHPMAGRETSGFAAADPDLFTGCAWVLCTDPPRGTPPERGLVDWLVLAELFVSLGARVVPATAAEHDRAVAGVSHVPHLLAAALATTVGDDPLAAALAAGSFRDGTRVAASRPELVSAMCGGNAAAVGPALDAVLHTLSTLRAALDGPEPVAALRTLLGPGHDARRGWPPVAGESTELPARTDVLRELGRAGGWVTAVAADRRTVTAIRPKTTIEDQN